jgi:excisionase family DNA binding protein
MAEAKAPTGGKAKVEDPFFSVAECAAYLNQTERWVRRQVEEGGLPFTKMRSRLRFRKSAVDEWIAENSFTPGSGR